MIYHAGDSNADRHTESHRRYRERVGRLLRRALQGRQGLPAPAVESDAAVCWIIAKDVKIAIPDALASGSRLSRLTITKARWRAAEDSAKTAGSFPHAG